MMISILSMVLFTIFLFLGGIHFYWLLGGTWALKQAIPTKDKDSESLKIPRIATLIVGLLLLCVAVLYLKKPGFVNVSFPNWVTTYAYWLVPSAFTLRAIGEFNYVGIFKKIKGTDFSKADTKIYIPLCTSIGLMGFLIQWLS